MDDAAPGASTRALSRGSLLPPARPDVPPLEIVEEIGDGGYAVVYRARRGDREYAVKILSGTVADPAEVERSLRREASLLACVAHPGLPRVHDVGSVDGRPYLVMDLISGQTLTRALSGGPLPWRRVLSLGLQLADLLAAVHAAGIVHRDVKPDNLLVGPQGTVHLIDFGFADGVARSEATVGTLLYCAPEQAGTWTRDVDARADLYSSGAVLFECLTGVPPFHGVDAGELLRLHATAEPPDPRSCRPDLPPELCLVVTRLLAKDPDDRYPDAATVAQELLRVAAALPAADPGDEPLPADQPRRRPPAAAATAVGRHGELAVLREQWARARAGHGAAALIHGAAGSGKTHLVQAFTDGDLEPGTLVLRGKCNPDDVAPLAALHSALDAAAAWAAELGPVGREQLQRDLRAALGLATALLPAVSQSLARAVGMTPAGGATPAAPADVDQHRQLPAVVATLLAELARAGGGLVLHLDDVQWLDAESEAVLAELARELPRAPVLVLLTARTDPGPGPEPGTDPDSCGRVDSLRARLGESVAAELSLGVLDADGTAALVAAVTGGLTLDAASAQALAASADGNPFTVLQFLRSMIEDGAMTPSWGVWSMAADALQHLALPLDGAALVLHRLDDLDGGTRRLLAVGAALGQRFAERHLASAAIGVLSASDRRRALSTAVTRGLLLREGEGRYRFAHDRIREALLDTLSEDQVRGVHDAAADLLEAESPTGRVDSAAEAAARRSVYALASHCRAGHHERRPERLFAACTRAGFTALAEHLPAVALDQLSFAAQVAQRHGYPLDAEFLAQLGTAQHRAGQFTEAAATLDRACALARPGHQRAAVLDRLARVHDSTWNTDEQAATVRRALVELGAGLPRHPVRLVLGTFALTLAGLLAGLLRVGRGGARGRRRERHLLRAALLEAGALAYARGLQPTTALVFVLRSLWSAHRLGRCAQTARIHASLAHLMFVAGLPRLGRGICRRARRMGDVLQDPQLGAYLAWLEAFDWYSFGLDQGRQLHRVWAEQHRWLDVGSANDLHLVLCWDAVVRGDLRGAEALFARRRGLLASRSDHSGRTADHPMDAALAALQGRVADAVTHLTRMRERAELRWERADIVVASAIVAVELDELGSFLDDTVALLDELGLEPRSLIPSQRALYVSLALARLERARTAPPEQRPQRLAEARRAVRVLRSAANTPLLAAHAAVAWAALAQAADRPTEALRRLDAAAPLLRAVDAPLVAHQAAVVTARACRVLGMRGESARHARLASAIATEEGWPLRQRRTAAEFGLGRGSAPLGSTGSVGGTANVGAQLMQQRLAAVEQVTRAASGVLDPEALTRTALDETIRVLGAERAYLFLLDGDPPRLVPRAGRTAEGRDLSTLTDHSASIVEEVVRTRQAQVFTGTEQGPLDPSRSVVAHGLRSVLAAPVELDDRLLGVVYLDSRVAKGIFSANDVGVLTTISTYVAIALENARASQLQAEVAAANRERDVADALRSSMLELSRVLEPEQVLERLLRALRQLLGADEAWLLTAEPDGGVRTRELSGGAAAPGTVTWDPATLNLLDADQLVVGSREAARPAAVAAAASWIAVPLRARDRRVGTALLAAHRGDAFLGQTDLATTLAIQAMVAYDNACLFGRVHVMATTDELTGVANRRRILAHAEEHRAGPGRTVLVMVDVDHFKTVNDRHGHPVGDQVLVTLAARMSEVLRGRATVGRYGGEEFLLVLDGVDDAADLARVEAVRTAICAAPVRTAAGELPTTVSMGLTAVDVGESVAAALERADKLLYQAKEAGRNRVCSNLGPR